MVYRIYVEKKSGFDGEAQGLCHELVDLLGIKALKGCGSSTVMMSRVSTTSCSSRPSLLSSASRR